MFNDDDRVSIGDLHAEKSIKNANSKSLARLLASTIYTGFHKPHKFIYEILQNAEDAEAKKISFTLTSDFLVIAYDGLPFKSRDVKRICDVCTHDDSDHDAKPHDLAKIGYKGIGFKSVFCVANKVTVVSNGYQFCFDKEQVDDGYPWQIIPILVERELPQLAHVEPMSVMFILEDFIHPAAELQKEIEKVCRQHESILFLGNIQQVNFSYQNNQLTLRKQRTAVDSVPYERWETIFHARTDSDIATIEEPKSWCLYQQRSILVPQTIGDKLTLLNSSECPQKIKDAKTVDIVFAAEISQETRCLVPNPSSRLYCGLPTEKESGLFFSVNANFLLNQDRTSLLNVAWNTFLLEIIGYHQFNWFAAMEREYDSGWQSLRLINPQPEALQEFLDGYCCGFERGLRGDQYTLDVAFIPSIDQRLLTVSQCVIDETGFFNAFYKSIVDEDLQLAGGAWRLVSSQLDGESLSRLQSLFLPDTQSVYKVDHLIEKIEGYVKAKQANLDLLVNIACFLGTAPKLKELDYLVRLREKKIFLNTKQRLVSAGDSFLPCAEDVTEVEKIILDKVKFVKVINDCYLSRSGSFKYGFNLDVFNHISFIRKFILPRVKKFRDTNKLTPSLKEHNLLFFETIFLAYWLDRSIFSDGDFDILRAFPVTIEKSRRFVRVDSCYLCPQGMDAEKSKQLAGASISKKYYMWEESQETRAAWQDLLKKMHIKMDVELEHHSEISFADLYELQEQDAFERYVNSIRGVIISFAQITFGQRTKFYPGHSDFDPNQAGLSPFFTFSSLGIILEDPEEAESFLNLFWFALVKYLDRLSKPCEYYARSTTICTLEEHFLVFCLKTYKMVKVHGEARHSPTTELIYSPSLQDLIRGLLPTPDLPILLSETHAKLLGFRTLPNLDEILSVLTKLSEADSTDINNIKKLYRLIIQVDDSMPYEKMIEWQNGHSLYALDGVWRPANTLSVHDGGGLAPKPDERWLHDTGLTPPDLAKLADKLGLSKFSASKDVNFGLFDDGDEESIELTKILKQKLLNCFPIIVLFQYQPIEDVDSLREHLQTTLTQFKQLMFSRCPEKVQVSGSGQYAYFLARDNRMLFYFNERMKTGHMRRAESEFYKQLSIELVKYFDFASKIVEVFDNLINSDMEYIEELKLTETQQSLYESLKSTCDQHRDEILSSQLLMPLPMARSDVHFVVDETFSGSPISSSLPPSSIPESFGAVSSVDQVDKLDEQLQRMAVTTIDSKAPPSSPVKTLPATPRTPSSSAPPEPWTPPINLGRLKEAKSTPDTDRFGYSSKEEKAKQTKINKKIGRLGEQKVYGRLEEHYRVKYPDCEIQDLQSPKDKSSIGFSVRGTKEGREIHLDIIFYNKGVDHLKDRKYDHDIAIVNYVRRTTRYIEVKTTQKKATDKKGSKSIELTESEYARMQMAGSKYSIFRVFNPKEKDVNPEGDEAPVIEKIKGAYQYMEHGMLSVRKINIDYRPIQFAPVEPGMFFRAAVKYDNHQTAQKALLKAIDHCLAQFYRPGRYQLTELVQSKAVDDALHLFGTPQDHGAAGDCLFKVIASFIPNATHEGIRDLLVSQGLGDHQAILAEAFNVEGVDIKLTTRDGRQHKVHNIQRYYELMQQSGTWGGYLDIAILAVLLGRPIAVLIKGGWPIIFDADVSLAQDKAEVQSPIFIYYNGTNHYQRLCPIGDYSKTFERIKQLANETAINPVSSAHTIKIMP